MTIRELVLRFCVQKLANILWECLAFSDVDRAETDWLTAEDFVKKNPRIVEHILQMFLWQIGKSNLIDNIGNERVEDVSFDVSYEMFVEKCGRMVWNYLYQPFEKESGLPHHYIHHYTHIRFG
jgi:hypothetical protein